MQEIIQIREFAVKFMESLANNPSIGYDQQYRWGERGDYDCSSAVISAWEFAGVPVKQAGATYTGNMYKVFLANGFEDVTSQVDVTNGAGLVIGDVLLNHQKHTAMYAGNGNTVEANINELGAATGGTPGDQTGREFWLRLYRNYPWDVVLRYTGKSSENINPQTKNLAPTYFYSVKLPLLKKGMVSPYVQTVKEILAAREYFSGEINQEFDARLDAAVRGFQADMGLDPDGEIGSLTYDPLLKPSN